MTRPASVRAAMRMSGSGAHRSEPQALCAGAFLLRELALPVDAVLLAQIDAIAAAAPWRHMVSPGGSRMSVAMTNCGAAGWVTDRRGYRYEARDPLSGVAWPPMPSIFRELAREAAACVGFEGFESDACLVNRYVPGARMSLHQDRDERDFSAPIVSVSLGLPATFLLGGLRRVDKPLRITLNHGDVLAWGGPARLRFHGILPLKEGEHVLLGAARINLTFRKAL